ncbi:RagB/SusD family nutrient uptake outer membrane protein [Archangium violaceum]|uniref:RagB/SusD family nutrient uptake outer membrane protein n=1 Tax=Archangium violaceum TaxID=83451 RepID=UPI0037C0990A
MKKTTKMVLALCATMGLGGCSLDVPDLNRVDAEDFEQNPTRASLNSAASGLLIGTRSGIATQNGYVSLLGVLGRESYVLDTADPRYVGELLASPTLSSGSPAFGGNFWTAPYANIRNANTLLNAVEKVQGLTEAEKESYRGFAKTIQAMDFLVIINTRDTNGAPIDVNRAFDSDLAPIMCKEQVLAHIARLLDEAKAHLEAAGGAVPIKLSSGFNGVSFIQFNRALKARVDVYRQDWNAALADVAASFIDPTGPLDTGVYHAFGTGSGDTPNELNFNNERDVFVHPAIVADAEMQADDPATLDVDESKNQDDRVLRKVTAAKEPRQWQGVGSSYSFKLYSSDTSPLPIIRNEELILLRAEANLRLGNTGAAFEDINDIRVRSGKLAPLSGEQTEESLINELLEQRRYSLLFEGGHRWIDMRRYGKLEELPKDVAGHNVHKSFPIPIAESDARQGDLTCVATGS